MNASTPPDPAVADVIELHAKRSVDIIVAALMLPLAFGQVWLALFVRVTPDTFEGLRGGWIFLLIYSAFGPTGPAVVLLLCGVWFGSMGLGSAWRALDRRPALVADAEGVTFHPAFFDGFMPWGDVRRIGIGGVAPSNLEFSLNRRIWAVESPLTALRVRMGLNYLGLSTREARRLVPRLNRLKRSARQAATARRRGPDAAAR